MTRTVIFLDFDGVICTPRACVATGDRGINSTLDPIACSFLNRMCERYDIRTVISSDWRQGREVDAFMDMFGAMGMHHLKNSLVKDYVSEYSSDYIEGETPKHQWATRNFAQLRGEEIQAWLSENEEFWDTYLILDDDSDMLEDQMHYFIQCPGRDGLSFWNMVAMEEYLKQAQAGEIPDSLLKSTTYKA